jgi:hypothetical protein
MFAYIIYPKLTAITVRTHDKIGPKLNSFKNIIVINKVTTINIVLLISIFLTPFLDKFRKYFFNFLSLSFLFV